MSGGTQDSGPFDKLRVRMTGRAPVPTRAGGQYITGFPVFDLLVVHKVNIDQDEGRNITEPTFMTMLDLVLDAKSK